MKPEPINVLPYFSSILRGIRESKNYMRFVFVEMFYLFFMSIMWPLMSITLATVINASMLEIALVSVFQLGATIVFQKYAGRLADRIGRKPLLLVFRFGFISVPFAYAFAPNVYFLIGISVIWGALFALAHASRSAYLLDTVPREARGSLTALYNLLLGVSSFFGSLFGGYFSDYTIGIFGIVLGLQIVYLISTVGRVLGAMTYLSLRETLNKEK